jgi:hypothetical protein
LYGEASADQLAAGWFHANLGVAEAEQWTVIALRRFLVTHGYDEESARWIIEQAEAAEKIEINVPDPKPN